VWPKRAAASIVCAALVIAAAGAPWLGTPLRRLVNTEADGRDPPYDVPLDVQSLRRAAEQVPDDATYWIDVFPSVLLLGTGAGLSFPSLMTLAMSGATEEDSGLASGLINTSLQVGGALGLAVLATLSATRTETLEGQGQAGAQALTGGYELAWQIGAGFGVVAIALAVAVLPSGRQQVEQAGVVGDDAVDAQGLEVGNALGVVHGPDVDLAAGSADRLDEAA